jgi:Zn-dependent peptidase ImmA (M78 family)
MTIERVGEGELLRRARALAKGTRREIGEAGLRPDDFGRIARRYGLTLCWDRLTDDNPGCYHKDAKTIVLDPRVVLSERLHFTFHHELMHDRIEQDEDLLSLLADAYIRSDHTTMERLCDAGAAELLMPSDDLQDMVRAHGFSTESIPVLCHHYHASSIAVAIHMASTASHQCYLVIAAPQYVRQEHTSPMLIDVTVAKAQPRLVMLYTVASPSAKYAIKRGQQVPADHLMSVAWQKDGETVSDRAPIPFASGTRWVVPCDASSFRGKVFAFFHASDPVSSDQMRLL